MKLSCIAVDDEPIALNIIARYIEMTPVLSLAGKCASAPEALQLLHSNPDIQLIFLDIRMADVSGMEMAKIIEQSPQRKHVKIIFTTAYDSYALESYRVNALDYLVKPFSFLDFSRAVDKAMEYFDNSKAHSVPDSPAIPAAQGKQHIYLKVEYQLVKLLLDDILYIEGLKDYVKVWLQHEEKPLLTLTSLKTLEEKLPGDRFFRLHRSYIINVDKVKATTKNSVVINQLTIVISEQYREAFRIFLDHWH